MDEFLPVVFSRPLIALATSVIFLMIGLALLPHALMRRRYFSRLRDGEQTYSRRASIRTEFLCAGIAGAMTVALVAFGLASYRTAMSNLEANVHKEYSPTKLDIKYWNGSWATADITFADGTSIDGAQISVQDAYRPFIAENTTTD